VISSRPWAGAFLLPATCTSWSVGCALCGNEIGYEQLSPDGKTKAVAFERDCGATTGFSTQVSLLPSAKKLPNEAGNIFVADGNLKVHLEWETNDKLLVRYPVNARVRFKKNSEAGISIRYEAAVLD
jgi:hypothetical protein